VRSDPTYLLHGRVLRVECLEPLWPATLPERGQLLAHLSKSVSASKEVRDKGFSDRPLLTHLAQLTCLLTTSYWQAASHATRRA